MLQCDLTFPTPEANLACDEALLETCEASGTEVVRFWEGDRYFVVVGYANRVQTEVNISFCQEQEIPIFRRCTGGGTVLQGPGCLNYSLILRIDNGGPLTTIPGTNAHILDRHCAALTSLLSRRVERKGQTDLAIDGVKFSGNAQRRRRDYLLFHGSFLLDFNLDLVGAALQFPSRQPEYRRNRTHQEFLRNLAMPTSQLKRTLTRTWYAGAPLEDVPRARVDQLVKEKYSRREWNWKL